MDNSRILNGILEIGVELIKAGNRIGRAENSMYRILSAFQNKRKTGSLGSRRSFPYRLIYLQVHLYSESTFFAALVGTIFIGKISSAEIRLTKRINRF